MADTTVTGQFGRENVALNNAASEATLLKLLAAIERQGGSKGDADRARQMARDAERAQKDYNKQVKDGTNELKVKNQAMQKFSKSLGDLSSKMSSMTGSVLSSLKSGITGVTGELLMGGNTVSDFAKHFSGLLGPVEEFIKFMDRSVLELNQLSQSGAAFNNSILDLKRASSAAGMDLNAFTSFIKANTEAAAMLGPSVTEGAKRLGILTREFRESEIGKNLISMGYQVAGVNEVFTSYTINLARSNRLQNISTQELIAGASAYAMELDKLTKLTGKSKTELEETGKRQMQDAKARLVINSIQDAGQREAARANLNLIETQFKALGPAFMDLIGDGIPNLDETKFLMMMDPTGALRETIQLAGKGLINSQELNNRMKQLAPSLQEGFQRMVNLGQIDELSKKMPALRAVGNGLFEVFQLAEKNAKTIAGEQQSKGNITDTFRTMEQTIMSARNKIHEAFIQSELFDKINKFTGSLMSVENLTKLTNKIVEISKGTIATADKYIADLKEHGFIEANKKLAATLIDETSTFIKELMGLDTQKPLKAELIRVGTEWIQGIFGLDTSKPVSDELSKKFKEYIANVFGISPTNEAGQTKGYGELLADSFMKALKSPELWTGIAATLAAGIIYHLGKGMFKKLPEIDRSIEPTLDGIPGRRRPTPTVPDAPKGSRAAGLIKGLSVLSAGATLAAIGGGLYVIAEALDVLDDIDYDKIEKGLGVGATVVGGAAAVGLIGGLIALKAPLLALGALAAGAGAGFVLKSFGEALKPWAESANTAADAADKYSNSLVKLIKEYNTYKDKAADRSANQIQMAAGLDATQVGNAADSLVRLQEAVNGFNPSLWASVRSGIGRLFTKDTLESIQELSQNATAINTAATGVENLKKAMSGFSLASMSLTEREAAGVKLMSTANFSGFQRLADVKVNDFAANVTSLGRLKDALNGIDFSKLQFSSGQQEDLKASVNSTLALSKNLFLAKQNLEALGKVNTSGIKSTFQDISKSFDGLYNRLDSLLSALKQSEAESPARQLQKTNDILNNVLIEARAINVSSGSTMIYAQKISENTAPKGSGAVRRQ